jgi:hypothetical protein
MNLNKFLELTYYLRELEVEESTLYKIQDFIVPWDFDNEKINIITTNECWEFEKFVFDSDKSNELIYLDSSYTLLENKIAIFVDKEVDIYIYAYSKNPQIKAIKNNNQNIGDFMWRKDKYLFMLWLEEIGYDSGSTPISYTKGEDFVWRITEDGTLVVNIEQLSNKI